MTNVRMIPSEPEGPKIHTVVHSEYFPACMVGSCADGNPRIAEFLMPATLDAGQTYEWVPVCGIHREGWWDPKPGFLVPEGYKLVADEREDSEGNRV